MSTTTASQTSELISQLDNRYPCWSMWRTGMKQWAVRLTSDHTNDIFTADTIEEALQQAVEFVPLPAIPRKPMRYYRSDMVPVKDGSKWRLLNAGRDMCVRCDTKSQAMASADGFASRSEREVEAWEQQYGEIAAGVEGVDFRYR